MQTADGSPLHWDLVVKTKKGFQSEDLAEGASARKMPPLSQYNVTDTVNRLRNGLLYLHFIQQVNYFAALIVLQGMQAGRRVYLDKTDRLLYCRGSRLYSGRARATKFSNLNGRYYLHQIQNLCTVDCSMIYDATH